MNDVLTPASAGFDLQSSLFQAKRFELNALSVAAIGPGTKLCHRQSAASNRSDLAMLRNQQNAITRSKQSANLQRRYGYLEKAFDGGTSHCLA
jgi:hypothetical protein